MERRQLQGIPLMPNDFIEFIQCLNSNDVQYLLVGGWAVGIYGHPRATKDIDFLVSNKDSNLVNLQKAFNCFRMPPIDINRFKDKGYVIRVGNSPVQIDIINEADGIDFDDSFMRKETVNINGTDIYIISKNDLIKNKRVSGRSTDIADAELLEYDLGKTK